MFAHPGYLLWRVDDPAARKRREAFSSFTGAIGWMLRQRPATHFSGRGVVMGP
jgi:hypothetical protein